MRCLHTMENFGEQSSMHCIFLNANCILVDMSISLNELGLRPSMIPCDMHLHYNNRGLFCDPNIIANNKERCFRNLTVANHNSSQILKLLRYHNIRTRTITSPSQLPNLIQSPNFSDYNCFYPLFAINITSETIFNKPITVTT
jgi:hypothetical protein